MSNSVIRCFLSKLNSTTASNDTPNYAPLVAREWDPMYQWNIEVEPQENADVSELRSVLEEYVLDVLYKACRGKLCPPRATWYMVTVILHQHGTDAVILNYEIRLNKAGSRTVEKAFDQLVRRVVSERMTAWLEAGEGIEHVH